MNKHIDIYNTIYDVDVVIANKDVTLEDLKEDYTYCNEDELDDTVVNSQATTARCKRKSDNRFCVLIKFNRYSDIVGIDKKLDLINTAAHEALHASMDIYAYIREDVIPDSSNEALAYFVGWLTQCIYNSWTRK